MTHQFKTEEIVKSAKMVLVFDTDEFNEIKKGNEVDYKGKSYKVESISKVNFGKGIIKVEGKFKELNELGQKLRKKAIK